MYLLKVNLLAIGEPNINGRIYSEAVLRKTIEQAVIEIEHGRLHVHDTRHAIIPPMRSSHIEVGFVNSLNIEDIYLVAEIEIPPLHEDIVRGLQSGELECQAFGQTCMEIFEGFNDSNVATDFIFDGVGIACSRKRSLMGMSPTRLVGMYR